MNKVGQKSINHVVSLPPSEELSKDGVSSNKQVQTSQNATSFQTHQTNQVDEAIAQGQVNTTAPSNMSSIQFLQSAMLQANFDKSQQGNTKVEKVETKPTEQLSEMELFIHEKKQKYSEQIQTSKAKNRSESKETEYVLAPFQLPEDIRELAEAEMEGVKEGYEFGEKDGLISESEVFVIMDHLLQKEELKPFEMELFELCEKTLGHIQEHSIEMEISQNSTITTKIVGAGTFEPEELKQLETLLSAEVDEKESKKFEGIYKRNVENNTQVLPKALAKAIFGYTTSDYKDLNTALRSGETIDSNTQLYIDGVVEGLNQLPSHQGVVWRGASPPQEVLDTYVPGQEIVEKAFASTSYGSKPAFDWCDVMYCIQLKDEGSAGKKVDHLSNSPGEREVLINAGTRFKVLANEAASLGKNGRGKDINVRVVYLQEL